LKVKRYPPTNENDMKIFIIKDNDLKGVLEENNNVLNVMPKLREEHISLKEELSRSKKERENIEPIQREMDIIKKKQDKFDERSDESSFYFYKWRAYEYLLRDNNDYENAVGSFLSDMSKMGKICIPDTMMLFMTSYPKSFHEFKRWIDKYPGA